MEPPHFYVRDRPGPAAHHWDYLSDRSDHALCGHGFQDPITLGEVDRPRAVCRACQALLPKYELIWWRAAAESNASALDDLRTKFETLRDHADNQRNQLRSLQGARRSAKGQKSKDAMERPKALTPRSKTPTKKIGEYGRLQNAPRGVPVAKKARRSNSKNGNAAIEARLARGRNDPTGLSAANVPTRGRPEKVKGGTVFLKGGLPGQGKRQR